MSIRRKIVGKQEIPDRELSDGFPMISGNPWRKVLGSLDATRCRFDRQAGDGDGSAGPAGIGV